jgi:hypothetical protein
VNDKRAEKPDIESIAKFRFSNKKNLNTFYSKYRRSSLVEVCTNHKEQICFVILGYLETTEPVIGPGKEVFKVAMLNKKMN